MGGPAPHSIPIPSGPDNLCHNNITGRSAGPRTAPGSVAKGGWKPMDAHLSCPRGHRWPLPDARVGASSLLICPVCGPDRRGPTERTRWGRGGLLAGRPADGASAHLPRACRDAPQVAGYEILCEIGRGGMGVVYQARQLKLNRVVALKMILDDCRDRPPEYARFLSEAEVIAGLNHPNIVQIHEIGEADGRPFFSLEFVEGGSLAQRLRGSDPLPPRQAARLIADLARGVDAAHRQGVVHRDLKPANVSSLAAAADAPVGECTPKITDFGLAKRRGERRQDHRRLHPRHALLHGPRTGGRPGRGGRPRLRRLFARRHPLRAAHRPAAVPGRHAAGHHAARPLRRPRRPDVSSGAGRRTIWKSSV